MPFAGEAIMGGAITYKQTGPAGEVSGGIGAAEGHRVSPDENLA